MAQARPDRAFGDAARAEGVIEEEREEIDEAAVERVDEAVAFADGSPFPPPESLYDDVYVLGDQVRAGTRSTSARVHGRGRARRGRGDERTRERRAASDAA